LRNVAKKYQKEIADRIKVALDDEMKMQELEAELQERGYSKAAILSTISSSVYGITGRFLQGTGEGSEPPTDWTN